MHAHPVQGVLSRPCSLENKAELQGGCPSSTILSMQYYRICNQSATRTEKAILVRCGGTTRLLLTRESYNSVGPSTHVQQSIIGGHDRTKHLLLFPLGRVGCIFSIVNALLAVGLTVASSRYVRPKDCNRLCGTPEGAPCPSRYSGWRFSNQWMGHLGPIGSSHT